MVGAVTTTLAPGQLVAGKYRLTRLLGIGGMAQVFAAVNVFTDRMFAVKCLLPEVARAPESSRRFLLEAKVSARVNHPNIVEVIDVGQSNDGVLFLVMELLEGDTLETLLERNSHSMRSSDLFGWMRAVASALTAAHKAGIVHRDLKPTNIFLHRTATGISPKLLDFGVSKFFDYGQEKLTIAGSVLGSPMYMSPEQAVGSASLDGRTDIFSLGSILFEALSGFRPFDAPHFNQLIVKVATTEPTKLASVAPNLPREICEFVDRCCARRAEDRFANCAEVEDGLFELSQKFPNLPIIRPKSGASRREEPPSVPPQVLSQYPRASKSISWMSGALVASCIALGITVGWIAKLSKAPATTFTNASYADTLPAAPSPLPNAVSNAAPNIVNVQGMTVGNDPSALPMEKPSDVLPTGADAGK